MANNFFNSSSNPILKDSLLDDVVFNQQGRMTVSGAVNKTYILAAILSITAIFSWNFPSQLFIWPAAIAGFVLVLVAMFKKEWSTVIAPIYAVMEGLFLGTISLLYSGLFDGIIFHAMTLTIAVLFLMLFFYKSGIITVTQRFRSIVILGTAAIAVLYLVSIVLSFFSILVPMLHDTGIIGIGFSLVVIALAALNLLLDFDFFDKGAQAGLPKYMEWFAAMGLIITLVWLYLEILRLLSKFSKR